MNNVAIKVLSDSGRPMHHREILTRILKVRPVVGRTPNKSTYAVLFRSERFIAVGKGVFALRSSRTKR